VKYFNGFSLHNEEELFKPYLIPNDTSVVGFSYGAQKAFDYAYTTKNRIDRLILLSPAFFQNKDKSFIRTQLHYFKMQKEEYVKQFLLNVSAPSSLDLTSYIGESTKEELKELLHYTWDKEKIHTLLNRGIQIEVFLGLKDEIINAKETQDFFSMTTVYMNQHVGHLLKGTT